LIREKLAMGLPRIQSVGLPPEKHADRIVADMLRRIVATRKACWPKLHGIFTARTKDGTPAAQERIHQKMLAAVKGFILQSRLTPGKRGKYKIDLLMLDGWNAETNAIIVEDDPIPEKPWIALSQIRFMSKGDYRYDIEGGTALLITHHALSRLAQRCGARDIKQVYGAVWDICGHFLIHLVAHHKESDIRDGERFRADLTDKGLGIAVCVLSKHRHPDCKNGTVLATLWSEGEPADD